MRKESSIRTERERERNLGITARTYLEAKVECKCSSESEFLASAIVFLTCSQMFEQKRRIDVRNFYLTDK